MRVPLKRREQRNPFAKTEPVSGVLREASSSSVELKNYMDTQVCRVIVSCLDGTSRPSVPCQSLTCFLPVPTRHFSAAGPGQVARIHGICLIDVPAQACVLRRCTSVPG